MKSRRDVDMSHRRRNRRHIKLLDAYRRHERGTTTVVRLAGVNRYRLPDEREVVVTNERRHVPPEVLHGPDDFTLLDQEQSVARHARVEQRLIVGRNAADVPEE